MTRITTLGLCGAAFLLAASVPASAQTTSPSAGNLTTAKTDPPAGTMSTAKRKPRATATPDMINEAIQRSEARAAKEAATGTPQQWGSEEPFTYNPAVRRDAVQQ